MLSRGDGGGHGVKEGATPNLPVGRPQQHIQHCPPIWPDTLHTLTLLMSIKGKLDVVKNKSDMLVESKTHHSTTNKLQYRPAARPRSFCLSFALLGGGGSSCCRQPASGRHTKDTTNLWLLCVKRYFIK